MNLLCVIVFIGYVKGRTVKFWHNTKIMYIIELFEMFLRFTHAHTHARKHIYTSKRVIRILKTVGYNNRLGRICIRYTNTRTQRLYALLINAAFEIHYLALFSMFCQLHSPQWFHHHISNHLICRTVLYVDHFLLD